LQPCVARRISGGAQSPGGTAQALCNRGERSIPPTSPHREAIDMDRDENTLSGTPRDPAEGRPDLGLPGADRPDALPDRQDDLPERLGERISGGGDVGISTGEPDLKPDVEVPEGTM